MVTVSQNGYSVDPALLSYPLPGGLVPLRADDCGKLLQWVGLQFDATVEKLVWPGVWGYAHRTIRGSTTAISNHASATALDLNAPKHPLGVVGTFNAAQVAAINAIIAKTEGAVRWGGSYIGRKDEMHFEINTTYANVQRILNKVTEGMDMTGPQAASLTNVEKALYGGYPAGGNKNNFHWADEQAANRHKELLAKLDELITAVKGKGV